MRARFDAQLDLLNQKLVSMGALCEDAIAAAVKAMLNSDAALAKDAITTDREIDQMERDIEGLCMKLLLQQQPVARDLRLISAAMKMVTDMERIGDQAADIAELISYTDLTVYSKHNAHIAQMATEAIKMVTESIQAFVRRDLALAASVIAYDDVVDDLFVEVKNDLIRFIIDNQNNGEAAIDILMIAKYLERIADHATNIAEWVEYAFRIPDAKDAKPGETEKAPEEN